MPTYLSKEKDVVTEEEEIKVYGPSLYSKVLTGGIGLGSAGLAMAFFSYHASHTKSNSLPFAYVLSTLSILFLWWFYLNVFHQTPQLILSPQGIKWRIGRSISKFYAWNDVGVFALENVGAIAGVRYLACAYNIKNHKALNEDIRTTTANKEHSDISIDLTFLGVGLFRSPKQKIVDDMNRWREKYMIIEINELPLKPLEVQTIKAKHETKVSAFWHLMWGAIILGVIMLIISLMSK